MSGDPWGDGVSGFFCWGAPLSKESFESARTVHVEQASDITIICERVH